MTCNLARMINLACTSRLYRVLIGFTFMLGTMAATPTAQSQDVTTRAALDEITMTGTVSSSTASTLVVRGENGQFQLFIFDDDTTRPRQVPVGTTVTVSSVPGEESGIRVARVITAAAPGSTTTQASAPQPEAAVPPAIRRVERDIARQMRRYQAGVRTGVAIDPELILVGVHAQVGPFFHPDVFFRPNVEFGFGEVTALIGVNLEAIYRLPVTSRQGRWTAYVGAGPGFNFIHQNFDRTDGGGKRVDFGNFTNDTTINFLGGLRYRSGVFMELKTSVYSSPSPTMRFIVGYNF